VQTKAARKLLVIERSVRKSWDAYNMAGIV